MAYCIYMHINVINHKVYIGQTNRKPEYRWNNGKGYMSQKYFWNDIEKYGWNNFDHLILKDNLTKEEADNLEKYYINRYRAGDEKYGYNGTFTGSYYIEPKQESFVHGNAKPVVCVETGQVFANAKLASEWAGLKSQSTIGLCCNGKRKSAGKHPKTKQSLHWRFVNEKNS